ncbi:hypothetical protein ACFPIJ_41840 [Dactylosporangium cerinum]|uniref:Uncharacterized protein n=1 Tax=Dactylosporangium cerinum TaxID=1434730 RepID=A0ABV9W7X0_9ACTN
MELDAYLRSYRAGGYDVDRVERSVCGNCGGTEFRLWVDDEVGYAARRCEACEDEFDLLDSADTADEQDGDEAGCPCGGETFEIAVGYALRADGDVRWVSVGMRCRTDGRCGVYTDWKIDYSPTAHLFDSA